MPKVQRPGVECVVVLERRDWTASCREAARLRGVVRRLIWAGALTGTLALAFSVLSVLSGSSALSVDSVDSADSVQLAGLPLALLARIAVAAVGSYAVAYLVLGPLLRWPSVTPDERTARWRIDARRIETDRGGTRIAVPWDAVRQLTVTRRLFVLDLGGRHGVLCLPRRCLPTVGQDLVVQWATAEGTRVVRRR